ncbi:unnamed protein product [Prunus armeniaca]
MSHLGCLIEDCKTLLARQESTLLSHTEMTANEVATRLARYAMYFREVEEWVTDPTEFLKL